ncbi:hypothetical protein BAY1663_04334 [Pseudomonas sp. BAY1663]|nr:hypothetical protein BAY1663_04334 [Pseudomonas sp. BAY1663]
MNRNFSPRPSPPGSSMLASRPLIPAIRPLRTTNKLAAVPISTPPAKAVQGVKLPQSMVIAAPSRKTSDTGW